MSDVFRTALTRLEKQDTGVTRVLAADGRQREMKIVNESGLCELIFGSTKPDAKRFRRWASDELANPEFI